MRALLLFLAALFLALLLAEGALRLVGQSYYWAVAKEADAVLGWRPAPNVAARQRLEGDALVRTNRLGFRDFDHDLEKPPGTLRIAVLGDSFTEAVQVPLEETWWRIMARRLSESGCGDGGPQTPAARIEVLNFAVSGYSTAQSLRVLREEALRFSPDAVLLAFFLGNDLVENSAALDGEPMRPYLRPGDGSPAWDDGFRHSDAYRFKASPAGRFLDGLMRRSRIGQTVVQVRHMSKAHAQVGLALAEPAEPGVDNGIYRVPSDPAWRDAWAVTEALLASFAVEVRAAGAQPLLLVAGTGAQVHPNAAAVDAFARRIGVPDLAYPVQRLLRAASAADLPAVNLPAIMALEAERTGTLLHGFDNAMPGFGHWNAAGHRVAGDAAATALCVGSAAAARLP